MTTRYEGAGATDTSVTVLGAGEEIGVDVVPEGQIALCFNYDEVFYIQGTPEEVGRALGRARMALALHAEKERPTGVERPSSESR